MPGCSLLRSKATCGACAGGDKEGNAKEDAGSTGEAALVRRKQRLYAQFKAAQAEVRRSPLCLCAVRQSCPLTSLPGFSYHTCSACSV